MCVQAQSIETKIIHNIQNEIITNIDIKNEFKYLVALNNSLKELDEEMILNISNESVIREKIKKIPISLVNLILSLLRIFHWAIIFL